jgi:predicted CoA-binding protein
MWNAEMSNPSDPIRDLLLRAKTIAVVGLSSDPMRPSFGVSQYMQRKGYRIIPVNPNETEVLGARAYGSLVEIPEQVDLVDVFRRPQFVPEVVDEAIRLNIPAIWLQEGVVHNVAAQKARDAGLTVVMDLCILKEHRARFR